MPLFFAVNRRFKVPSPNLYIVFKPYPDARDFLMEIGELKPRSNVEKIELVVVEKEDSRGFINKLGVKGKVCNATAADKTGARIGLTLWNDEIDKIDINDKVRITNGWVKEWNGILELSAGKFGKLEVLK